MARAQIRTPAIVLRRTNYGEADRILQLLTPEQGKVSVMSRGVRREKSKLAGGIELFATCDVTIMPGKGDIGTLTGARLNTFFARILKNYDRMQLGYEVIKQVSRATEMVSEPAFYELMETMYASLDDESIDIRLSEAWFWLQLAILQGAGLNLSTDANGMKLVEGTAYEYDGAESVFVYKQNGRFTTDHIKLLRLLSVQAPRIAAHVSGIDELLNDCLWLARQASAH